VINQTPPSQQGGAIGTFTSFWDLGVALGGPIGGVIVGLSDYPAIFYVMVAAALASAALGGLPLRNSSPGPAASAPGDVDTADETSTQPSSELRPPSPTAHPPAAHWSTSGLGARPRVE
jgi:MFS family permease